MLVFVIICHYLSCCNYNCCCYCCSFLSTSVVIVIKKQYPVVMTIAGVFKRVSCIAISSTSLQYCIQVNRECCDVFVVANCTTFAFKLQSQNTRATQFNIQNTCTAEPVEKRRNTNICITHTHTCINLKCIIHIHTILYTHVSSNRHT